MISKSVGDRVARYLAGETRGASAGAAGERQGVSPGRSTADRIAAHISGRYPSNLATAEAEGSRGEDKEGLAWKVVDFVVADAARERAKVSG